MTQHLVVIRPFLKYQKGDIIAGSSEIREILDADYGKFVNKVALQSASKG